MEIDVIAPGCAKHLDSNATPAKPSNYVTNFYWLRFHSVVTVYLVLLSHRKTEPEFVCSVSSIALCSKPAFFHSCNRGKRDTSQCLSRCSAGCSERASRGSLEQDRLLQRLITAPNFAVPVKRPLPFLLFAHIPWHSVGFPVAAQIQAF